MFSLVYYSILILCTGVIFTLGFIFYKKSNKAFKIFTITASLLLALFFILRYMSNYDFVSIASIFDKQELFGGKLVSCLAILLIWFTYSSNLLLSLYGFFSVKRINAYVKFICFPVAILNLFLLWFDFDAVIAPDAINSFNLRGVWYAIEVGIALGYAFLIVLKGILERDKSKVKEIKQQDETEFFLKTIELNKYNERLNNSRGAKKLLIRARHYIGICLRKVWRFCKKYWFEIFAVLVLFLSTMPSYTIYAFFGKYNQIYKAKDFEIPHRIIIYIGLILPFIVHYSLRNKEYKEKKFYLMFICLGTLLTYSFTKKFDSFLDPTLWPLHLCNTAMYIMPIVLMFNMKRFFYFTYFINVLGAFFAMLMPNYGADVNIFDYSLVNFYVNHYIAFFMPILFVSLGMFKKPRIKQFIYSMLGFAGYFVLVLVINAVFTGLFEAGLASRSTDYFFINSDFIAEKLGLWAERLRNITVVINVGGIKLTFYPVYQVLFFIVYVLLGLAVWFIYEQAYSIADTFADMRERKKKIRLEQIALTIKMNGRSLTEPMNPENENKLILRNFTKRYGNSQVLAVDNANLEVFGGEIFGFLGPNGAGKSTIIKTVVGIQPITSGEVEVCGYDINSQSIEAKRCIGFVPDHYALYEKLTGREYINYIADLYQVPLEERNERIDGFVKRFELEGAFDNQMKTYSHGMKQKIAIMAALVHDPKVWILDEPLTGLDPNSIYQVKECMKERAKAGNIVFFSSHIIDVVERICDRIAIIKKGKILLTKTVKEIEESGVSLEDFYMQTINGKDYKLD